MAAFMQGVIVSGFCKDWGHWARYGLALWEREGLVPTPSPAICTHLSGALVFASPVSQWSHPPHPQLLLESLLAVSCPPSMEDGTNSVNIY